MIETKISRLRRLREELISNRVLKNDEDVKFIIELVVEWEIDLGDYLNDRKSDYNYEILDGEYIYVETTPIALDGVVGEILEKEEGE